MACLAAALEDPDCPLFVISTVRADFLDRFGEDLPRLTEVLNRWGLHDMQGNVFEWVQDCSHDSYANAPEDGRAWREENGGDCSSRVMRGGSWYDYPDLARPAFRTMDYPFNRDDAIGFRVVCSSPSSGSDQGGAQRASILAPLH